MNTTIALIQMTCSSIVQDNLQKVLLKIDEAAAQGAQIISVSELFASLYFCQDNNPDHFKLAEPIPGPTSQALSAKAKEHGVVLVGSIYERAEDNSLYNTAIVFDTDGKILGTYRKIHIPDDLDNHYSEKYYFKSGDQGLPVFCTKFGTIGVLICWDQWYPEPARVLASRGAQIIFYPTAIGWPSGQETAPVGQSEHNAWVTMQRSHAIANGCFVAAINRVGTEDHIKFWGTSFVADPMGVVLTQATSDQEELIIQSCDLNRIPTVRKDWPFLECRQIKQLV